MGLKRTEAKITIAKFLELAYSKDKGMTVKIMANKGGARLTLDQNGKATLSGTAVFVNKDVRSFIQAASVSHDG